MLLVSTHKRSVGIYLLLVPRSEALASPVCRNEQRRSPRWYVYKRLWLHQSQWWLSASHIRILHTHGRHCCFDVWQTFRELPDSRTSSTKRQVTPFLYIGSRPAASTHWASAFLRPDGSKPAKPERFRKRCKDTNFLGIYIALPKKEYKMAIHKACGTVFGAENGRNISKNLQYSKIMPIFAPTNPARFP